jgi:hypothetical protein
MCLPAVPLLIAASAASAAVGAAGAIQQGQAQSNMAKYQANMAEQQSQLAARSAEQNTTITKMQAANDTKQLQRRDAEVAGSARAAMAANGIAGSGTAADLTTSNFDTQKLDEMSIRYNADLKSWGIKEQLGGEQWNLAAMQEQYKMSGQNAKTASYFNAGSSLLSSASQFATAKMYYSSTGARATNTASNTGKP